jgi:uncharacterized protein Yka (UPF0111/DUF47 family)
MFSKLLERLWPKPPDFFGMLSESVSLAHDCMHDLRRWAEQSSNEQPSDEPLDAIGRRGQRADQLRDELILAVQNSYETPMDREDLASLSRAIDDIVDETWHAAQLLRALHASPDHYVQAMAKNVDEALEQLQQSFDSVSKDRDNAMSLADKARHAQRRTENMQTEAFHSLVEKEDPRLLMRLRETYMAFFKLGEMTERLAEMALHSYHKMA